MKLKAMLKWQHAVHLVFWPHAVHCIIDVLSNAHRSRGFIPKEIFAGTKGGRSFRNFHTFGSPAFVLDPGLQAIQNVPEWKNRSHLCVFLGKSKNHASNVSLILDPHTNFIKPQFHLVHDDDFLIVSTTTENVLPAS